ncbi:MAG: class I SAM-dependent methyltransferase [Mycobacteriales bacterium]
MSEPVPGVTRRAAVPAETTAASRRWWDADADAYQAEHGAFLGDARFVWCPEGLDEADARLLGEVAGRTVLEIGAGAAQCSRWLVGQGARVVALDLSAGQLAHARALSARTGIDVPLVQGDAEYLPLRDISVDIACSAFGAVPFVADSARVMREVARVLRPGGRWVFSVTHPMRWAFADDPGPAGLTVATSYFDRTAYVEQDATGTATYGEHHRPRGDGVRELVGAGLVLDDVVEPEWPAGHRRSWGQWSPLRGGLMPGSAIFSSHKAY